MKNKKILLIAAALVLVLAAVAVALCLPKGNAGQPQLGATLPGATESGVPVETGSAIHDYYPQVTFLTHNNEYTQRVTPGTLPQVPSGESGYDGLVFTGWNAPIRAITEDTVYEAVYEPPALRPRHPFPIKSLVLSACMSPWTIHFRVLDKSPLLGLGRGLPFLQEALCLLSSIHL